MTHHTQLEDNLVEADNLQEWKYIIFLILEKNNLDQFISKEVPKPYGYDANSTHKRSMDKAKRIIAYSIKDHLIPHFSSLKTPKEVFDALMKLFKGKNINQKMTLRNRLKNANIKN